MKSLVAAVAVVLGLASGALAADPPLVVEETPAGGTVWDGFYAGVGITGAYNVDFAETFGFVDGVVGFNVQADTFVFGGEVVLSGWQSNLAGPGLSTNGEIRGGVLVTDDVLLYGSVGALYYITGGNVYGQLGVGVEFAVADNTTLDVQYKYWRQLGGAFQTHSISTSLLWHF
jgi:opacity protein-like surface antigen